MRLFVATCVFGMISVFPGNAGTKKVISPSTSAGNDQVDIVATVTLTEEEVTQKLGADPGRGIILLEVRVIPKTDKPVQISPEISYCWRMMTENVQSRSNRPKLRDRAR
jgi:hypothetical protein